MALLPGVAYKKIIRLLFGFKREDTSTNMLVNNIRPFSVLARNYLFGFKERIESCDNKLVHILANSLFYVSSRFCIHYIKVLYTQNV